MKNTRTNPWLLLLIVPLLMAASNNGCDSDRQPVSASGVSKTDVKIQTGSDGLTTEQRNVRDRLLTDNKPGSIKHLYVISAYSGQVLIYSTVRGKVTSSGKRLTPTSVIGDTSTRNSYFDVDIGGRSLATTEVLQDDGTYGSSIEYLYWWDTKGVYHQHYKEGGQIIHVSDQPIAVKSVIINMEVTTHEAPTEAPATERPTRQ